MFRGALLIAVLTCSSLFAATGPSAHAQSAEPSAEQRIPFKRSEESTTGIVLRVFGGLFVAALVGVGVVYLLKNYVPSLQRSTPGGSSQIRVLEVRRLTPKVTLFLVEADGARLLLGQSGDSIATLHEYSKANDGKSHA